MLPDVEAWSAGDESPDRAIWVQGVSRRTLWAIASIFSLPDDRAAAFQDWFDAHVAPAAERRDPGVMEAIATTLFQFLSSPLGEEQVGLDGGTDDGE
jgi:hypothetical protein